MNLVISARLLRGTVVISSPLWPMTRRVVSLYTTSRARGARREAAGCRPCEKRRASAALTVKRRNVCP